MSEIPNELRAWAGENASQISCAWLARVAEYIETLESELAKCRKEIAEGDQCIEDVCTGGRLVCPDCNKTRPCLCHDVGGQP